MQTSTVAIGHIETNTWPMTATVGLIVTASPVVRFVDFGLTLHKIVPRVEPFFAEVDHS